jgi:hypothetical protein
MNLSTQELAQLRADAEDYQPDTCTIQVPTATRTTDGGYTTAFANTYTGVVCRLAPVRSSQGERLEGDQMAAMSPWILTIAYDQAIAEGYRVVHDSETYEVTHIEDTHSNRTAKRVYLRRTD